MVNLKGTQILAELSQKYQVERFVFISSDKAIEPAWVMGASKNLRENLIRTTPYNQTSSSTTVHSGNVPSRLGSVVTLFLKQIYQGEPVTVTDKEMTCFFMGLSEAVILIIQAASYTHGGDVFMLNIGQAMKISDSASKLIRLKGLRVDEDIAIAYTRTRAWEKLTESLIALGEEVIPTPHPLYSCYIPDRKSDWD